MVDFKVGKIFGYRNTILKVYKLSNQLNPNCVDCYFFENDLPCKLLACTPDERKDKNHIIFKEVK